MTEQGCRYCAEPASKLCDGFVYGTDGLIVCDRDDALLLVPRTCDAPLCDAHAITLGNAIVCGRGPCVAATIDYCPSCARREGLRLPRLTGVPA